MPAPAGRSGGPAASGAGRPPSAAAGRRTAPGYQVARLATSYWTDPGTGAQAVYDPAEGGEWSRPPAFPAAASGLVSTVDDYLAFGQMLLQGGRRGRARILSRASVELMTTDHLTPAQKAAPGLQPGYCDSHGWGFGLAVVTRHDDLGEPPGSYGWDGRLGTSWRSGPREGLVIALMTQQAWPSPSPPAVCRDFWTSAYQAIAD